MSVRSAGRLVADVTHCRTRRSATGSQPLTSAEPHGDPGQTGSRAEGFVRAVNGALADRGLAGTPRHLIVWRNWIARRATNPAVGGSSPSTITDDPAPPRSVRTDALARQVDRHRGSSPVPRRLRTTRRRTAVSPEDPPAHPADAFCPCGVAVISSGSQPEDRGFDPHHGHASPYRLWVRIPGFRPGGRSSSLRGGT